MLPTCAICRAMPLLLAAAVGAQQPTNANDTIAQRLLDARARPAALHDLLRAGNDGTRAVFDAFAAAAGRGDQRAALSFATALAELGTATSAEIPRLLLAIPRHDEPLRGQLLRALTNGALLADADARERIVAAMRGWADAGILYSPSAEQPTFAWYDYVRLVRRLRLAGAAHDPRGLQHELGQLAAERGEMAFGGVHHTHFEIEAHGAHGQRELLEGIGELAFACPGDVTAVVAELAGYLGASPPRPPITRQEHCAGIGENAPNALPGAKWPTLWLYDEWHFACAQAVFARHQQPAARLLALRHLLHASRARVRLDAIEALRAWPRPWSAFAAELTDCLGAGDRNIVREALVTIGQAPELAQPAAAELQRLAAGADRELAALARAAQKAR